MPEDPFAFFELAVKGGEKPDQRAEQNTATATVGVRWSEEVGNRLGGGGCRKRREGVARPEFPAQDRTTISPWERSCARG